jgi:hypothetical protein
VLKLKISNLNNYLAVCCRNDKGTVPILYFMPQVSTHTPMEQLGHIDYGTIWSH